MRTKSPILLVEDDKVDQMSVKRAMKDSGISNQLLIASNGEEALAILNRPDTRPGMIFLDLNMPKMNGMEFLAELKQNDALKAIPVIVLTTSGMHQEKNKAYSLGICGYMIKPVNYAEFLDMFKAIDRYWAFSEMPEL
jgi:CheY-like chemotaxis protein